MLMISCVQMATGLVGYTFKVSTTTTTTAAENKYNDFSIRVYRFLIATETPEHSYTVPHNRKNYILASIYQDSGKLYLINK